MMNTIQNKENEFQTWVAKLEERIQTCLMEYGWEKYCTKCPNYELYESLQRYFREKGFTVWKESYNLATTNTFQTGEYSYLLYISK